MGNYRLAETTGARILCAAALAWCMALLPGCDQPTHVQPPSSQDGAETTAVAEGSDEAGLEPADADAPDTDGETTFDAWAPECLDRNGDITVHGICELKGWELETLLQQQGYSWDTRNQLWLNEREAVGVSVLDATGKPLSDDAISELQEGSAEAGATYRLVTGRYSRARRAFEALAQKVMDCEDRAFDDGVGVAVVSGPSGRRALVLVTEGDSVVTLTIAGQDALAAGLLDKLCGQKLGSTVDEAFETLAGRPLGTEE